MENSEQSPETPDEDIPIIAFFIRVGKILAAIKKFTEIFPWHPKKVHVRVVRRGTKAIAKWNRRNADVTLKLENASLSGAQLAGADLGGANFFGADLSKADLRGAQLGYSIKKSNITRILTANLEGANLQEADLSGASIVSMTLESANLHGARMAGARLLSSTLNRADLRDADLLQADLDYAKLHEVALRGASFVNAKLFNAELVNCDLSDVDFTGANLTEADLDGTTHYREIRSISGAIIGGVRNAPEGFVEWALDNGAVDEAYGRSWVAKDSVQLEGIPQPASEKKIHDPNETRRKIIWPVGLLGILLFVTGIGAMVQSEIRPIYHAFQSRDWEEIDAEIILSEFGPSEESVLGFKVQMFRPHIEYRYRWEGRVYTGRAFKDRVMESEAATKSFAEAYPVGREMRGFLNVSNPAQSELTRRKFGSFDLLVTFMLLIVTVGGAFCIMMGFGSHTRYDQ